MLKKAINPRSLPGQLARTITAVIFVSLTACASIPKAPDDAFLAADNAIKDAEQARVADYASPELVAARDKIAAARALAEKAAKDRDAGEMQQSRMMAEDSRNDAELASALSQQAKAESANKGMQHSNQSLQEEIQRKGGN